MEWFILILLGSIWGTSYLFIKLGVAEIPPVTFAAGRVLLAALVLGMILLARRERLPRFSARAWLPFFALGLCNCVIPYILISWGETEISSGLSAILVGAMPIFTVLIAHFWTADEKLTRLKSLGIGLGFLGVVAIFYPELANGIKLSFFGMVAVVLASASYGFAIVLAHRYVHDVSSSVVSTIQFITASVVLIPLGLIIDRPLDLRPSLTALGSLASLALFSTAIAYLMYYWLIDRLGATRASLVTYISPVVGLLLGALILYEKVDVTAIVGLVLIIAGIALVNRKVETNIQTTLVGERLDVSKLVGK